MSTPPPALAWIAPLLPAERGFVLAAALFEWPADAVMARLPGAVATRCGQALDAFASRPRDERAAVLATLLRGVRQPPHPDDLAAVHPSWVEEALATEPPGVVVALTQTWQGRWANVAREVLAAAFARQGATATAVRPEPATLAELASATLGPLADAAAARAYAPERLAPLLSGPDDAFEATLAAEGARTLGRSLVGSAGSVLAHAMAQVGPPWAELVRAEGRAGTAADDARREAAELAVWAGRLGVPDEPPRARLARLGAFALARRYRGSHPAWVRALAVRLPRAVGIHVLEAS